MLEKLTWKLCNILLSNENFEMTILLPYSPRKANRNIASNYNYNRNLHNIQNELIGRFAKHCK